MSDEDLLPAFEKLKQAAARLPEVEESLSYATPALRVGKEMLSRVKTPTRWC